MFAIRGNRTVTSICFAVVLLSCSCGLAKSSSESTTPAITFTCSPPLALNAAGTGCECPIGPNRIPGADVCVNGALGGWKTISSTGARGGYDISGLWTSGPADTWLIASRPLDSSGTNWVVPCGEGEVLRWNGTTVSTVSLPPLPHGSVYTFSGIIGFASNDVWVTGSQSVKRESIPGRIDCANQVGIVLHWDGVEWANVPLDNPNPTNRVLSPSGVGPSDVWFLGQRHNGSTNLDATVYHWDGKAISTSHVVPETDGGSSKLTARGADDVWLFASPQWNPVPTRLFHWNGADWTQVSSGLNYRVQANGDIWGVSEYDGTMVYWSGSTWTTVTKLGTNPPGTWHIPSSFNSFGRNDVWANVEDLSNVLPESRNSLEHFDGSAWSSFEFGCLVFVDAALGSRDLWAVSQCPISGTFTSGGQTYTSAGLPGVGDHYHVWHWDGAHWTDVLSTAALSVRVRASDLDGVWVVVTQRNGAEGITVLHRP